jgi:hypothetical protein
MDMEKGKTLSPYPFKAIKPNIFMPMLPLE